MMELFGISLSRTMRRRANRKAADPNAVTRQQLTEIFENDLSRTPLRRRAVFPVLRHEPLPVTDRPPLAIAA
ncbi:MAG: hypothetical protein AAGG57_01440 [Pseudomonadota bacterium]